MFLFTVKGYGVKTLIYEQDRKRRNIFYRTCIYMYFNDKNNICIIRVVVLWLTMINASLGGERGIGGMESEGGGGGRGVRRGRTLRLHCVFILHYVGASGAFSAKSAIRHLDPTGKAFQ